MLELFKALSDPCRLRLVAVLLHGEFTVQELTRMFAMGQSRISRHLKILSDSGILTVKRQGTWSYYRTGDGNDLFSAMLPALETGFSGLPEWRDDQAAVALILEERRRRSQEFFNRNARQWDDLRRTLLPVPDYLERLTALLPDDGTILEVGTGTGALLPMLAAGNRRVIGVDHSPAMLEEARRRIAEEHLERVELRLGEMSHVPVPDVSVDCLVANMTLHHAADPLAVLKEFRRTLGDRGALLIADLARHDREWVRERLADQWLGFEEGELREWLDVAGFVETSLERIDTRGTESVLLVRAIKPDQLSVPEAE